MQKRRDFLRSVSALAGASLLTRQRPDELFAQDKKLGFALVGLGSLSTRQLAPALQRTKHCRLAAIVTGTPAKAARWRAQYGIVERSIYNYETMERLADNADVDVVYVVTPNALHAEHTIKAARAGKHVLCEKPMEVSVEKCQAMIGACRRAGRQLAIGYRCHFEPHHLACVRLARDRTFGALRTIEAGFGFSIGDPAQWRLNRALAGGGPLMDVGIYALQTARMLTGEEPLSVTAHAVNTGDPKFHDVEESMTFRLKFPRAVVAKCETSYKTGMNSFTASAEHGSFGMRPAYNYGGNAAWRSDGVAMSYPQIDQFAAEMDDFARCIMSNTPTSVPGEEGLRDVRIMMAAYHSARSGREVSLG